MIAASETDFPRRLPAWNKQQRLTRTRRAYAAVARSRFHCTGWTLLTAALFVVVTCFLSSSSSSSSSPLCFARAFAPTVERCAARLFLSVPHASRRAASFANRLPAKISRRDDARPLLLLNNKKGDSHHDAGAIHDDNDVGADGGGSVLGASLLFAGTAIGAGMLALPAETMDAGFVPSVGSLALCWLFTYVTSMVTLEASWVSSSIVEGEEGKGRGAEGGERDGGGGFLSISRQALGLPGEVITGLLFWFLLTSIVVAYTAEGGQLLSQFASELGEYTGVTLLADLAIPPAVGSAVFAIFFGSVAIYGTSRVDFFNRIFVAGLLLTFVGLVGFGVPQIDADNLLSRSDWNAVYPAGISIGILSFGAQNVVPTLLKYLGNDPKRTRTAILIGSLTPLAMYAMWEAVFLGVVSPDAMTMGNEVGGDGSKMQVVTALGDTGGPIIKDLVEVFSACAIGSSMAGASISLVDFFQDFVGIASRKLKEKKPTEESKLGSTLNATSSRLLAAVLALGPPIFLAYAFPGVFLVALEEAGLLGGVSLYGILPAFAVVSLRRRFSPQEATTAMPGRLGGGDATLIGLGVLSVGLVLPEVVRLGEMLLG